MANMSQHPGEVIGKHRLVTQHCLRLLLFVAHEPHCAREIRRIVALRPLNHVVGQTTKRHAARGSYGRAVAQNSIWHEVVDCDGLVIPVWRDFVLLAAPGFARWFFLTVDEVIWLERGAVVASNSDG